MWHSGEGRVDIWDIADGSLSLIKQIVSDDVLGPNAARQEAAHPHQSLLDNSGRFFVVNDLGTDTILVIDSQNDDFEVVNRVRVTPDGCGPRHGAFFPTNTEFATHYFLLCELLNLVEVFQLTYTGNSIQFFPVQTLSTFVSISSF
jgi:6-phosphogluconolactonase (cycloisomerase 2 family)